MPFSIDALYYAVTASAAAIGAVVGFGLQLRTLRKARLEIEDLQRKAARAEDENKKLKLELQELGHKVELTRLNKEKTELEVDRLRKAQIPTSPFLVELTTDEVIKYADLQFAPPPSPASTHAPTGATQPASHLARSNLLRTLVIVLACGLLVSIMEGWGGDKLRTLWASIQAFLGHGR